MAGSGAKDNGGPQSSKLLIYIKILYYMCGASPAPLFTTGIVVMTMGKLKGGIRVMTMIMLRL